MIWVLSFILILTGVGKKIKQNCTHYIELNLVHFSGFHFSSNLFIFMLHLSGFFLLRYGDIWKTALQTEQLDFNLQETGGKEKMIAALLGSCGTFLSWYYQGWFSWYFGKDEESLKFFQILCFSETELARNQFYKERE